MLPYGSPKFRCSPSGRVAPVTPKQSHAYFWLPHGILVSPRPKRVTLLNLDVTRLHLGSHVLRPVLSHRALCRPLSSRLNLAGYPARFGSLLPDCQILSGSAHFSRLDEQQLSWRAGSPSWTKQSTHFTLSKNRQPKNYTNFQRKLVLTDYECGDSRLKCPVRLTPERGNVIAVAFPTMTFSMNAPPEFIWFHRGDSQCWRLPGGFASRAFPGSV